MLDSFPSLGRGCVFFLKFMGDLQQKKALPTPPVNEEVVWKRSADLAFGVDLFQSLTPSVKQTDSDQEGPACTEQGKGERGRHA